MSEHSTARGVENPVAPSHDTVEVERAATEGGGDSRAAGLMSGALGRNLGLVVALMVICLVGVFTAGDRTSCG